MQLWIKAVKSSDDSEISVDTLKVKNISRVCKLHKLIDNLFIVNLSYVRQNSISEKVHFVWSRLYNILAGYYISKFMGITLSSHNNSLYSPVYLNDDSTTCADTRLSNLRCHTRRYEGIYLRQVYYYRTNSTRFVVTVKSTCHVVIHEHHSQGWMA